MGAYPKIYTIGGHRDIKDILDEPVEVTEKLDGSQLGFGMMESGLIIRSKGQQIKDYSNPDGLFKPAVEHILKISHKLELGFMYYGETLAKPKHNKLTYKTVPFNNIALYGVRRSDGTWIEQHADIQDIASFIEVDYVPLIIYDEIITPDDIITLLDKESYLGGCKIEGVVVKRFNPFMVGKYVSDAFKEKMGVKKNRSNTWDTYKAAFCTEARWDKAEQHLREMGLLLGEPKDIGALMRRVNEDIIEEHKEEIIEALWKMFGKELLKEATTGLPQWYKEQLMKGDILG